MRNFSKKLTSLFAFTLYFSGPHPLPLPFPNYYQNGIVYETWGNVSSADENLARLTKLKELGARHISVPIFICQSTLESDDLGACGGGSDADINAKVAIAKQAQSLGMSADLMMLPHAHWAWRGYFEPKNIDQWFKSYSAFIIKLAKVSEENKMSHLVIGSEIERLFRFTQQWIDLANEARKHFHGPLVINANWGGEYQGFWSAVDAIGLSAYYPLSTTADPTDAELVDSWKSVQARLIKVSKEWNRPIHFSEVGYMSNRGSSRQPYKFDLPPAVDLAIQERSFRAFSQVWSGEPRLVRSVAWATNGITENRLTDTSHDPLGKPAMAVLTDYFNKESLRQHDYSIWEKNIPQSSASFDQGVSLLNTENCDFCRNDKIKLLSYAVQADMMDVRVAHIEAIHEERLSYTFEFWGTVGDSSEPVLLDRQEKVLSAVYRLKGNEHQVWAKVFHVNGGILVLPASLVKK